jgi:molybdate transport system substrate-binding protein
MWARTAALAGGLMLAATSANAAEINVVASTAMREILEALVPQFERESGSRVTVTFLSGAVLPVKMKEGAQADVVVTTPSTIDDLVAAGKVVANSRVDFVRSSAGVAVRAGAPKPDIGSVEAFRRTLLSAKSIVATDPAAGAASGIHFAKLIERLGIADAVKAKTRLNSGSYNAEFVARGEAELAIQQISEILPVKGAELVGPLPADIQVTTLFKVAIAADASEPAGARELIAFLRSRAAAQVIAASGMEPA